MMFRDGRVLPIQGLGHRFWDLLMRGIRMGGWGNIFRLYRHMGYQYQIRMRDDRHSRLPC